MLEPSAEDLLSLDRDVERMAGELGRWREDLASNAVPDLAGSLEPDDPFELGRHVAGKSMWDALQRLDLGPAEALHRDALRRWVYALMQARTGLVFEVAMARAKAEPRGRFGGSAPRLVSLVEAWRGVVGSSNLGEAGEWLGAAADAAARYGDLARRQAARRVEVARRLGFGHPWLPLISSGPEAVRALALKVLDATEDLWRHVSEESLGPQRSAAAVFRYALAREAGEGWPRQLSMPWLAHVTGLGANRVDLEVRSLPANLGPASFLRALYAAGFAARAFLGRVGLPFALAHDPMFVSGHTWALAFSSLGLDAAWQVRELGLGRRVASAQVRRLAQSALLELRVQAARVLLGDEVDPAPARLFEETSVRLVGLAMDDRLRCAWPSRHEDDPARLLAWVLASRFVDDLREGFDTDWYRNPRAWSHLRQLASRPAREEVEPDAVENGCRALARAFEVALG